MNSQADPHAPSILPEFRGLTMEDSRASAATAGPSSYCYKPLPSAKGHFRLLKMEQTIDILSFSLTAYSFDSAPEYAALSYTWGAPANGLQASAEALYAQHLEVRCNGKVFSIGRNLFEAFLRLRTSYPDIYLWADAICINQKDLKEQGDQVAQMGDIYARAVKVIAWLGLDTLYPEMDDLLWLQRSDFRQHLFELEEKSKFNPDPGHNPLASFIDFVTGRDFPEGMNPAPRWQAFENFYGRCRWWSRAWVLQEVVLAQEIVMFCGRFELDWDKLRSLANLIRRHKAILVPRVESFRRDRHLDLGGYGRAMYTLRSLCINGGPEATSPDGSFIFRETKLNKQERRLFAFIDYALSLARPLGATKLQDKVYCVFGLINRFLPPGMEPSIPDYELSPQSVYYSMASMLIGHGPNLSVLSSALGPVHDGFGLDGVPTWVPDYSVTDILPRRVKEPPPGGTDSIHIYRDVVALTVKENGSRSLWRGQISGSVLSLQGTLIDTVAEIVSTFFPLICSATRRVHCFKISGYNKGTPCPFR